MIGQHWVVYKRAHDNPTSLRWWKTLDQNSRNRIASGTNGEVNTLVWRFSDMPFANSVTLVLALRRDLRHLDKELGASTSGIFERNLTWRQNNLTMNQKEPEGL